MSDRISDVAEELCQAVASIADKCNEPKPLMVVMTFLDGQMTITHNAKPADLATLAPLMELATHNLRSKLSEPRYKAVSAEYEKEA